MIFLNEKHFYWLQARRRGPATATTGRNSKVELFQLTAAPVTFDQEVIRLVKAHIE